MKYIDRLLTLSDNELKDEAEAIRQIQVSRKFLEKYEITGLTTERIKKIEAWFVLHNYKWTLENVERAWKETRESK